jgi:chitodextrinase
MSMLPPVGPGRKRLAVVLLALSLALMPSARGHGERQGANPPPIPLAALALSVGEVQLSWPPSTGAALYTLRRNGALLATLYGGADSFRDTRVQPSAVYSYTITATNPAWVESAPAPPAVVQMPALPESVDTTPPSRPGDLSAAVSADAVTLDWQDAADDSDITVYQIRRNGELLATVNSGTLSYTDRTVAPKTDYIYTVEALDVLGQHSPLSNPISAATPGEAYPRP